MYTLCSCTQAEQETEVSNINAKCDIRPTFSVTSYVLSYWKVYKPVSNSASSNWNINKKAI